MIGDHQHNARTITIRHTPRSKSCWATVCIEFRQTQTSNHYVHHCPRLLHSHTVVYYDGINQNNFWHILNREIWLARSLKRIAGSATLTPDFSLISQPLTLLVWAKFLLRPPLSISVLSFTSRSKTPSTVISP